MPPLYDHLSIESLDVVSPRVRAMGKGIKSLQHLPNFSRLNVWKKTTDSHAKSREEEEFEMSLALFLRPGQGVGQCVSSSKPSSTSLETSSSSSEPDQDIEEGETTEKESPLSQIPSPASLPDEKVVKQVSDKDTDSVTSGETSSAESEQEHHIPLEVQVFSESSFCEGDYTPQVHERVAHAEMMAQEYFLQLRAAQELADSLSKELTTSKNQVHNLMIQNQRLLNELKAVAGKDDATVEADVMINQEMTWLKTSLFFSMVFVLCGGKPSFIILLVVLWTAVDIFEYDTFLE